MEPRVIYETWAPPNGRWSPWAKPVLFAHLRGTETLLPVEIPPVQLEGDSIPAHDTALILDLPGLEAIDLGLDLVRLGFRPVPLFNACPVPPSEDAAALEVVPATLLLPALLRGAERLQSASLSPDAPPAFLLDAHRHGPTFPILPGWFDNRWVVFPTDFPSANFLASCGIVSVRVIHRGALRQDLVDVLRTWRKELTLSHIDLNTSTTPTPLTLAPAWWTGLARMARRLWVLLTLRHNPRGGFGGFVPEASSAGG